MSEFNDKVVVVTGGANGIGKCITEEFRKEGALIEVIDKAEGDHYVGDISDKMTLEAFAKRQGATGCCMKLFACTPRRIFLIPMRSTIPR